MMEVVFGESLEERLVFFQMEIEEKHSGQWTTSMESMEAFLGTSEI